MTNRFVDIKGKTLFTLEDGEKVELIQASGRKIVKEVKGIDSCHFQVGGRIYHTNEFAEIMEQCGVTYRPASLGREEKNDG